MGGGANSSRLDLKSLCDFSKPIAIVAGGGRIPSFLADFIVSKGGSPFIFMIAGNADPALEHFEHEEISAAHIGKLITGLKARNIEQVVLVGSVGSRPRWTEFKLDWTTIKLANSILAGLRQGDDNLLSRVLDAIAASGATVLGAHEVMPSLLMPHGLVAGKRLSKSEFKSIELGLLAARQLGALDAGQGCVVIGEQIVALEGAEGTDGMLARVADLRAQGRLSSKAGGVLVKVCKPQQDRRVDLPTIGVSTLENAARAKLSGIAIGAGSALIVDADAVVRTANELGLFVYGAEADA